MSVQSSWDVFISHAREDRAAVASPLAEALARAGLRVWIDEHEISLGDRLTTEINEGLARSRYGIVILSPDFLAKEWPKRELAALLAIELKHGKRVLPVLHNLELESILRDFPLIGDKVFVSTAAGIEAVASEICRATGFESHDQGAVATTPLSPEAGSRIGPYVIEAQIGAGGSGVVYRVLSSNHPFPLALKLFYPLRAPYTHLFPLFARGFRAVAAVRHPNVVGAHDHGVFEFGGAQRAYFTMDLVEGVALDVWCRLQQASSDRYRSALPVFRQVAAALCAAHETSYLDELGFEVRSVLHGDVKPANIIVDTTGYARLLDFLQLDVQRLIDPRVLAPEVLKQSTPITAALGTPGFMAPEQERHGIVTVATDVYGLGITFATALADKATSNPIFDLYRKAEIPLAFRDLVLKMVDSKPENRPARMRDVLDALGTEPGADQNQRSPERQIAIAEIETGEHRGRLLVLTEGMTSVTIGRSRDCDFVLDDYYVSRSHCRLEIQPATSGEYRFTLIDFGSSAGTIVNTHRVDRVELRDGDRFQIGSVRFRFRILDVHHGAKPQ